MNILSFDIEEWYLEKEFYGNQKHRYAEYDRILDQILQLLNEHGITATFFCLGKIAFDFPEVVKKIARHGHEIGCHSNSHRWVNKMTRKEFEEDTYSAVSELEAVTGNKIRSYRAPAFSIGESNKWALEVLFQNGIVNDASIFPGVRDFGGFPNFTEQKPCIIRYNDISLNEFPIPLFRIPIIGKEIAFSGGGYFRLLPFRFVKTQMTNSEYAMCYFHIADLLTEKAPLMSRKEFESYFKEQGPFLKRLIRYYKTNIGRQKAISNLVQLIEAFQFFSIEKFKEFNKIEQVIEI